jgi:hypothetical protein
MTDFLASTQDSRRLLALLYLAECDRKRIAPSETGWREMLEVFSVRLGNLSEAMRVEVLSAHLMSVEDIDIFHDDTLSSLLHKHEPSIARLAPEVIF